MKIVRVVVPFTGIALDSVIKIYVSDRELQEKDIDGSGNVNNARLVTEVAIQNPKNMEWIPSRFPNVSWKEQKEFLESGAFHILADDSEKYYLVLNTCKYCRESDQTIAAQGQFIDDPHIKSV